MSFNDVLCLQVHFLSVDSLSLLKADDKTHGFAVPAKNSGRGRPSNGLAILISSHFSASAFVKKECFLGIKIANLIVYCYYLPTDYKNLASEKNFSRVTLKMAKPLQQCSCASHRVILAGDENY